MTEREGWHRQSTKQCPDSSSSPCVRQSRKPLTVLDSRFRTVDWGSRYRIPVFGQWNSDSGFQSLVGIRILWARFQIPKPRSLDSTSKIFPESEFHKQKFPGSVGESGLHNNLDYIGWSGHLEWNPDFWNNLERSKLVWIIGRTYWKPQG